MKRYRFRLACRPFTRHPIISASVNRLLFCIILILLASVSLSVDVHIFDKAFLNSIVDKWGGEALKRVLLWESVLKANAGQADSVKLAHVNGFFNQIRSVPDRVNWGVRDYWATPIEMLAVNGADCEDFAVAKYFSLKLLGVAESRLRLTYVRSYERRQRLSITSHLVLLYYRDPDAEPLVLDNLDPEIKPASERADLVPTYSFNADGLWKAQTRTRGEYIGNTAQLHKWQGLLRRMNSATPPLPQ